MAMQTQAAPTNSASWTTALEWSFVDGKFVGEADAVISLRAQALHYGTGTFEGIRASWNALTEELYLLEPEAHFERMHRSANVLGLQLPYAKTDLVRIAVELLRRNQVRQDAYVRPLYILAGAELSVRMHNVTPSFSLTASAISGAYINLDGVRCMVSSWRRAPDLVLPGRAKITGSYIGPALAKSEANAHGFDEALMLNMAGRVAEGTTTNLFLRRGTRWSTPSVSEDILEGITRRQVMTLIAEETGSEVVERGIDRSELYVSDELLLCGTAAQIAPVIEVDRRKVGDGRPGAESLALARGLGAIARRQEQRHPEWTVPVYGQAST